MDPQGFNEISRLRASDADRDRAASVINNAMAEGRLTAEEHSDRLDAIYAAKTHADLVPVLDDLGAGTAAVPAASAALPAMAQHTGPRNRIVAIFGGATRKGAWHIEPVTEVLTVFGGAELDLRDAVLPARQISIKTTCVFGGVEIIIPPEMRVVDSGSAIFGGREVSGDTAESAQADAPVLYLRGFCAFGGVEVKRKARRQGKGKGWKIQIERPG